MESTPQHVYQVADWDMHFENNKSRERDACRYACIPNKQDTLGFGRLMSLPNGTRIYGVFHLIVCACSRQNRPRNGWMTDTGKALSGHSTGTAWTAEDLAFRWRRPIEEITEALDVLCSSKIGWIKRFQLNETESARQVPAKCPPSAPDRVDRVDRVDRLEGGDRIPTPPNGFSRPGIGQEIPSLDQVKASVMTRGIPEDFTEMVYRAWVRRSGKDGAQCPVGIVDYVNDRWTSEETDWRNGNHRANRNRKANGHDRPPTVWELKQLAKSKSDRAVQLRNEHAEERDGQWIWPKEKSKEKGEVLKLVNEVQQIEDKLASMGVTL